MDDNDDNDDNDSALHEYTHHVLIHRLMPALEDVITTIGLRAIETQQDKSISE